MFMDNINPKARELLKSEQAKLEPNFKLRWF
jgi:hypothetical protein